VPEYFSFGKSKFILVPSPGNSIVLYPLLITVTEFRPALAS